MFVKGYIPKDLFTDKESTDTRTNSGSISPKLNKITESIRFLRKTFSEFPEAERTSRLDISNNTIDTCVQTATDSIYLYLFLFVFDSVSRLFSEE